MTRHTSHQSGYLGQSRHSSSGLALVIGLHGAAIALALLAKSGVIPFDPTGEVIKTYTVPTNPPPEPIERVEPVEPEVELPNIPAATETGIDLPRTPVTVSDPPLSSTPSPPATPVPTVPDPIYEEAVFTRSALAALQPRYPSNLLRQDLEGSCTIRVRIAPNGRVMAAEPVNATHPAFCEATQRHALRRWRFEPATRDGVPVESWQRHTVEFRIS
ncbi:TonB family protein [Parasphingopyxis algicola]|uniref:energy transducer TonB n=1 Tax=Parasphingopyxis algicola TaxID=2026624 RepID=UPI0015A1F3B3|nr:energy transducer TonB [Parasphingopyxis algicola]QLC25595.1 TonB family protein [Parasphingopyxis algicola]